MKQMLICRYPRDRKLQPFEPTSWTMLKSQLEYIKSNPTVCKTVVIDTIDWAEQLCIDDICSKYGKKGIEDFGYGNGYVYEKEEFGRFLNSLEDLIDRGINVVLIHSRNIKVFCAALRVDKQRIRKL